MTIRVVEIPVHEVFQTFCTSCMEVVQVPFLMWTDQKAALRWAIQKRVVVFCPDCRTVVELDMPRAA